MEGRRTDDRHVTVETQISRDGDPEQPAKLQSWTQALELVVLPCAAYNSRCSIHDALQLVDDSLG